MERIFASLIGSLFGLLVGRLIAIWHSIGGIVATHLAARTAVIDPGIERLAAARALVGLVLVLGANLLWNWEPAGLLQAWSDAQMAAFLLPVQIAGAVIVAGFVLFAAGRRGDRRRMLRAVLRPIGLLGLTVFVIGMWVAVFMCLVLVQPTVSAIEGWGPFAAAGLALVLLFALSAGMAAIWHAGRLIVKDCFRARDAHPAMRAIVILVLSAWTIGMGVLELTSGSDPATGFPYWASVSLLTIGPAVNVSLSVAEIIRLRTKFGIDWRSCPA